MEVITQRNITGRGTTQWIHLYRLSKTWTKQVNWSFSFLPSNTLEQHRLVSIFGTPQCNSFDNDKLWDTMINHDKKTTGFGGNPQRKRDGTPVQLRSRAGSTTRREVVASELRRTSTSGCRWRADWALPASSYRTMGFFIVKHLAIKG